MRTLRVFSHGLALLLAISIITITPTCRLQAQGQSKPSETTPSTAQASATAANTPSALIQIEKVGHAVSGSQNVKFGEVVAVKLKTEAKLEQFDALFINGFRVDIQLMDTSDVDKTVFFKVNHKVLDVVEQFMERSSIAKSNVPVTVSLGSTKPNLKNPLTTSQILYLEVKPKVSNIYIFAIITLGALGLILLALRENVLKDDNNLYYSLGRTQLFYWTVLFVAGYLYIWIETDVLPDLTESMLVILGISIGTTAVGKVVENNTKEKAPVDPNAKSEGWFIDILSDSSSINIQRFQSVLFNFVFGGIFLQRCLFNHALPEFDDNVLLLMGISSSTYAGLKVTEPVKEQKEAVKVADGQAVPAKEQEAQATPVAVAVG